MTTPPGDPRGPLRRLVDGWLLPFRVAASWPGGRRRLLARVLVVNLVDAVALYLVAGALPGVEVRSLADALIAIVIVQLLTILVRPITVLVTRRSALLAFLAAIALSAVLFQLAALLSDAFQVGNFVNALLTVLGVGTINLVISGLLSLDEDESFYGRVLKRMSRDRGLLDESRDPGTVIIQIDGLAAPVLRHAMRTGVMPYVARWVSSGSHRLLEWETDLPSMTSSSQAGILHGNNAGIPAFRWFEKATDHLMVSNRPDDAAAIERRIRGERDLLAPNGTSIANLFSGGAARSLLTTSTVRVDSGLLLGGRAADELAGFLVNPYNLGRVFVQSVATIVVEWFEARRQRLRDVRPRMHRGGRFPILRAVSSVVLRDLTTTYVIEDIQRGAPIIYADLLSYDEIAHHAGPERPESMRELEAVDRQIRTIVRGADEAPRPYRFVLLSDHGQSLGSTFRQRYGEDLETVIRRLTGSATVHAETENAESAGRVDTLLREGSGSGRVTGRVARRALRRAASGAPPSDGEPREVHDVVVCASGNLALVFFPALEGRATIEEIESAHPGLVGELAAHPGIGFVMVRSAGRGALVLGRAGTVVLADGGVEGEDPLVPFGPRTLDRLRRLDGFETVGDLVLVSSYDPATDEVAAFEELIGSHGGLGGPQTSAFILVPSGWAAPPRPLAGAESVNAALRAWLGLDRPVARPAAAAAAAAFAISRD
ncbi:MAG TPA: alkaline phosphatase family protein [Candidatus Limnocylindrales bacterium]